MVFGPNGRGRTWLDEHAFDGLKTLAERLHTGEVHIPPVTERMPEPCPCCGTIHPKRPPLKFEKLPETPVPVGQMFPYPFM